MWDGDPEIVSRFTVASRTATGSGERTRLPPIGSILIRVADRNRKWISRARFLADSEKLRFRRSHASPNDENELTSRAKNVEASFAKHPRFGSRHLWVIRHGLDIQKREIATQRGELVGKWTESRIRIVRWREFHENPFTSFILSQPNLDRLDFFLSRCSFLVFAAWPACVSWCVFIICMCVARTKRVRTMSLFLCAELLAWFSSLSFFFLTINYKPVSIKLWLIWLTWLMINLLSNIYIILITWTELLTTLLFKKDWNMERKIRPETMNYIARNFAAGQLRRLINRS